MQKPKCGRAVNKPFQLTTFPCQAKYLHQAISDLCTGSGDPRSVSFTAMGYLRDELLSRYTDASQEGLAQRATLAVDKLLASETKNKSTNLRFAELDRNPPTKFVTSVLNRATLIIADIIGDVDYNMFLRAGFSSGSTTSRLRKNGEAASKYDGMGDVTPRAFKYIKSLQQLCPLWAEAEYVAWWKGLKNPTRLVEGNVVFTVPKNNVIERAAAKEPDYNMYLQRAVGGHIRRRLKIAGVDLDDQSVNQKLARYGSKTGTLATLDLSAASDSVTTGLIQRLFDIRWVDLLFDLRSERGILPGTPRNQFHTWEMLSSMGNGFTFEVESLVFYSLCRAVAYVRGERGKISVYGDDLIVPTAIVSGVRRILHFCGFTLNTSKSFYDTPFRESCGKHYYAGADVTPFYLREPVVNHIRLIHFLNRLREWGEIGGISDPRLWPLWVKTADRIPASLRGNGQISSITRLVDPSGTGGLCYTLVSDQKSNRSSFSHYIASLAVEGDELPLQQGVNQDTLRLGSEERPRAKFGNEDKILLSQSSRPTTKYKLLPHRDSILDSKLVFPQEILAPSSP